MDFKNEFNNGIDEIESTSNRLLHIYYDDKWLRKLKVVDSDKTTLLYDVETNRMRRPDMIMRRGDSNDTIGTVKIHLFRTRIETYVHDQHLQLTSSSCMKGDYSYTSPALQNTTLTWQPRRKLDPLDMVLLDDKAMPIAKFSPTYWAKKKTGKIEFLGNHANDQSVMDEIVVTALAIMQFRHIQMRGAAAGAAAS